LRAGGVFGYRANGMRRGRRPSVVTPILLVSALAAVAATPRAAPAGAFRLVDGEGVVHLTDVPADPRYRAFPGSSGTTAGWLRLPLRRWAEYADDIQNLSRLHGVPAALIESVIRTESAFDPTAVSPKGAGGLMQLMPQTAAALGVTNRFDPRENIGGGVRHLRYLLDRYHGNVRMALAAYNAGQAAVDAHRGVPPFSETRAYVERVLRLAGPTATVEARQIIYRYVGPDDTLTYSNLPPASRQMDRRP
jgi:soluble lytic murein transglycosylase